MKKSIALLSLFLVLTAGILQAAPVVDLEVAMETPLPLPQIKQWASFLQKAGFTNVQIRSAKLTDKPQVKTLGKPESRTFVVTGILAGDQLVLPGGSFKYGQVDAAKTWIRRLQGDGADSLTTEKGAYGLSRDEIVKVYDELTKTVKAVTADRPTKDVIRSISRLWDLQVTVDPAARGQLFSEASFKDELQGLTSGTASSS